MMTNRCLMHPGYYLVRGTCVCCVKFDDLEHLLFIVVFRYSVLASISGTLIYIICFLSNPISCLTNSSSFL